VRQPSGSASLLTRRVSSLSPRAALAYGRSVSERAVTEYVVECLWPDVHESDLRALDMRATAEADRLSAAGTPVSYLGSLLMREDEVVLCLFEGGLEAIRAAVEAAEVPFDRILEAARSPWNLPTADRP
jgi:hypothetical protein